MKFFARAAAVLLSAFLIFASVSCAGILPGKAPIPIEGTWNYSYEDSDVEDYYWIHLVFSDLKPGHMDLVYEYVAEDDVKAAVQNIISAFSLEFSEGYVTSLIDPSKIVSAETFVYDKLVELVDVIDPGDYLKILTAAGYSVSQEEIDGYLSFGEDFVKEFAKTYVRGFAKTASEQTPSDIAIEFGGSLRDDGLISTGYTTYSLEDDRLTITTSYSGSYNVLLDYDDACKGGLLSVEKIAYTGAGSDIENEVEEIGFMRIRKGMALEKAADGNVE